MATTSWLAFLAVGLLTAFAPGPAVALAVATALGPGPRTAALGSAGNVAGVLAAGVLSITLLHGIADAAGAWSVLRIAGGMVLLALGARSLFASAGAGAQASPADMPPGPIATFAAGAGVALLNPKSYLFFGVIAPGLAMGAPRLGESALQVVCFAGCTALSHAVYILACARAPLSGRTAACISRACGAVTALLGAGVVASALRGLLP